MEARAKCVEDWELVRQALRRDMNEGSFASWIDPLSFEQLDDGTVTLAAPSKFIRDSVESMHGAQIKSLWRSLDTDVRRVAFAVRVGETPQRGAERPNLRLVDGSTSETFESLAPNGAPPLKPITPDAQYSFDNFVVGRPNEFAFKAAWRASEDWSNQFNPVFLYGPSGLGKTHLLHAIARRRQELHPDQRVLFISAESFLVGFVAAVRGNATFRFKEMFRDVEMLLVDDVHQIVGKNYTQAEFLYIFNYLTEQGKQIILSSDRCPTDLEGMDERLRTRLGSGLVADLHPTDFDLRRRILETRTHDAVAKTPDLEVDPKVVDFLAQRIASDVRTLGGALNRLFSFASITKSPATVEMAQRQLQDLLRYTDRKISVEEIQRRVAERYGIRLADMLSHRRARVVARPRQIAMYLCKTLTQKSLPEIGRRFHRDHTTVMHAVKRVTELRSTDSVFDEDVEALRRNLEG